LASKAITKFQTETPFSISLWLSSSRIFIGLTYFGYFLRSHWWYVHFL
jgi:hypothetical protein